VHARVIDVLRATISIGRDERIVGSEEDIFKFRAGRAEHVVRARRTERRELHRSSMGPLLCRFERFSTRRLIVIDDTLPVV